MPAGPPPAMQQVVWMVSVGIRPKSSPDKNCYATPSFFCKLVDDVVY